MNPRLEGALYVAVIILKFQNGQPLMVACKAGSVGMVQGAIKSCAHVQWVYTVQDEPNHFIRMNPN